MASRNFGTLADGREVDEVVLSDGDLTVKVIAWGAVVRDVRLAGVDHPLVLGFDRLEHYLEHSPYFGAVAGRCANRIAGGRFEIDGNAYELSCNDRGNHLHGGPGGFGTSLWRIADATSDSVTLAITSADGDQGYPGEVEATCRYSIHGSGTLRMDAEAATTRPTLINLAQHSYFNLGGTPDILDHEVRILADTVTATDENDIPTGGLTGVEGTPFDFRSRRGVRMIHDGAPMRYDINYALVRDKSDSPRAAVHMRAGGVSLDIATTEPGIQFYSGHKISNLPVPGLDGRHYGPYAGCCFEPQFFPDAINHAGFLSPIVRPGERYIQTSLFAFGRV